MVRAKTLETKKKTVSVVTRTFAGAALMVVAALGTGCGGKGKACECKCEETKAQVSVKQEVPKPETKKQEEPKPETKAVPPAKAMTPPPVRATKVKPVVPPMAKAPKPSAKVNACGSDSIERPMPAERQRYAEAVSDGIMDLKDKPINGETINGQTISGTVTYCKNGDIFLTVNAPNALKSGLAQTIKGKLRVVGPSSENITFPFSVRVRAD